MHIEIVSIGDELLKGMVINTNAAFLSRALFENGYEVSRHTVFSDEPIVLDKEFRAAISRSSVIISTGGLGSTLDDHTRSITAALFGTGFSFNEEIAADLRRRYGDKLVSLKDQATIPSNAMPLLNTIGTAPGLVFTKENKMLILLPGVPIEMQTLFNEKVLPLLKERFPVKQPHFAQLHLCLVNESKADPVLRELHTRYPDVHMGIYPDYAKVSVLLRGADAEQFEGCKEEFVKQFATHLFSSKSPKIEEALQHWFIEHKKHLALAESCTGGAIAAQLVSVPGASDYFSGSLVTYSDAFKMHVLGVSEHTLKAHGAVSAECVKQMLDGLFKCPGVDYGIAVSGVAGPTGGSAAKPVGTVWAAIGERGKPFEIGSFTIPGNRPKIIQATVNCVLGALYRKVVHGIPAFPLNYLH